MMGSGQRINNFSYLAFLTGYLLFLSACVGPTTPFGAIHTLTTPNKKELKGSKVADQERQEANQQLPKSSRFFSPQQERPQIHFHPKRQVLHDMSQLTVTVYDPQGVHEDSKLRIFHNGVDITPQVIETKRQFVDEEQTQMVVEIPDLRIRPDAENKIQFVYLKEPNDPDPLIRAYKTPSCSIFANEPVATTAPFDPPQEMLDSLNNWAKEHDVNPSFLAGLVAQESAFNPKAVSWAKAIGLTQVTPLADKQIARVHSEWPRSPKIDRFPATVVKSMIVAGQISEHEDWRLNPDLSLRGGLALLDYLQSYWKLKENQARLTKIKKHQDAAFTSVLLASYHSGASRVKRAIDQLQTDFLSFEELHEAQKYVRLVSSYCYHFANTGGAHGQTP